MVIRLKLVAHAARRTASHARLVSGASVVITASIVAMFGAIMPAALGHAPRAAAPPVDLEGDGGLLREGVGRHDRLGGIRAVSLSRASAASAMPSSTRSTGSGTPMTPVEQTSTSSSAQPSATATACAIALASASPCAPVHAFALPALMTTAAAVPEAMCARDTSTGAAATWFVVNRAAAATGSLGATRARGRADLPA